VDIGQQCGIPERVAGDQLPETDRRSDPQQRRNEDKTFKKGLFSIGFKDGSSHKVIVGICRFKSK
jgi:hypothetical protein